MSEIKTDEKFINHIRNIKLLQAIYGDKKFFVECYPTDDGAHHFPNSNFAVKEIELPNFDLYEEKLGYKWVKDAPSPSPQSEQQIKEWIEEESRRLGKESTAPDKETPNWMIADIKRGMRAMHNLLLPEIQKRDEEIERLKGEKINIRGNRDHLRQLFIEAQDTIMSNQKEIDQLNQTIEQQKKEIQELKKEIDGWIRYKQNIDEALNSGDGVYRP